MASKQGAKAPRRGRAARRTAGAGVVAPTQQDRNRARREQYAVDPQYAERQKQLARQTYNRDKPLVPKLANGLLTRGTMREVVDEHGHMEFPQTVESFTVPEAAAALGRTELTLKRWIEDDLIPQPILRDTSRNYRQYSVGELTVIARELQEHEREFRYYATAHTATRERIAQHVFAYRQQHV